MSEGTSPLPLIWRGVSYRSKVEACWAEFFYLCGIVADYELNQYPITGGYYLPDFWLHRQDHFVEIKGAKPEKDELTRLRQAARSIKKPVVLLWGSPLVHVSWDGSTENNTGRLIDAKGKTTGPWQLCACPNCFAFAWTLSGDGAKVCGRSCRAKSQLTWQSPVFLYNAMRAHEAVRWKNHL